MTHASARDAWLGVEVRHLQALAAIAREGSFREAAESLGYVQSAISQQVAQLERLGGARLIERTRGSTLIELTDAGRLLLEHVEEILRHYQRADAGVAALAAGQTGRLRVGAPQSIAARLLPRTLLQFASQCPDVQVLPSESTTDTVLLAELETDELDLAFCELPLDDQFGFHELIGDPLLLMVNADSPLAQRGGPVAPRDLDGLPLATYSRWRGQQHALDWLATRDVHPEVTASFEHNATVQSFVACGTSAALAPSLAVDSAHPHTALLPIAEIPPRVIALAWHRQREPPPPATRFRAVTHRVCHELARDIARAIPTAGSPSQPETRTRIGRDAPAA